MKMIKTVIRVAALSAMVLGTSSLGCGDEATKETPNIETQQQSKTLTCGQAQCQVDAQVCLDEAGAKSCVSIPSSCAMAQTCECIKDALGAQDCQADPAGGLRVEAMVEAQDPCMTLSCTADEECKLQDDGSAKCESTIPDEPDPVTMFACDDKMCQADTQYCSVVVGGAPGSGTSASCIDIPMQCQGAMLDCDCLKMAQGAQDCSQDAMTMGYTVQTFAP